MQLVEKLESKIEKTFLQTKLLNVTICIGDWWIAQRFQSSLICLGGLHAPSLAPGGPFPPSPAASHEPPAHGSTTPAFPTWWRKCAGWPAGSCWLSSGFAGLSCSANNYTFQALPFCRHLSFKITTITADSTHYGGCRFAVEVRYHMYRILGRPYWAAVEL
jgi:hypothetical protein